jgi:hypothetical protein
MMTKWDTIQADVADAYAYLDEEENYYKALLGDDVDLDSPDPEEYYRVLTLDWEE